MKHLITIKKLQALVIEPGRSSNAEAATALNAEMIQLGYVMSRDLHERVRSLDDATLETLYAELLDALCKLKGAQVRHNPMYPNFPRQIEEASWHELCTNAIRHYLSWGAWFPAYEEKARRPGLEPTRLTEIGLTTEVEFRGVFDQLIASNESLSEEDRSIVAWYLSEFPEIEIPSAIPYKETLCFVVCECLARGRDISGLLRTATDVLRVITQYSGGDISLATNTRFVSLPRRYRKSFVQILERVAREEDIKRHAGKWIRLFHSLHVGDYSKRLFALAKKLRNKERLRSFNSDVELAISTGDVDTAVTLLKTRPSDFVRRLDHLIRTFGPRESLIDGFRSIVSDVPTRVLLQLLGNLATRFSAVDQSVVFPKGQVQKAVIIARDLPALDRVVVADLMDSIEATLRSRFATLEPLEKVWIDPALAACPVPTQQRSSSRATRTVARGTRMPLGDKKTLRFFVYWVGLDIDLSATFHDARFRTVAHVSYTNLKSGKLRAYHSGDITNARRGATEFIDLNIDAALKAGVRYVAMNVLVYRGPSFKEHDTCFAGWMTRSKPNSNEIFEPKTVAQKVDLASASRNSIPVVFDLVERKAIWTDMSTSRKQIFGGNNVESNRASIEDTMEAVVSTAQKVSLYTLFALHAESRGELVERKDEAETVFAMNEGITPFDINTINADFVV